MVAVAGGKGGVGKSLLASNLALYLAQSGRRVVLLDADPHACTAHGFCGGERPPEPLAEDGRSGSDGDRVLVPAGPEGLRVAWAAGGAAADLLARLARAEADYLVIDLPPALDGRTLDLWLAASAKLLVFLPEPRSIEGAFRFVRTAFARRIAALPGGARLGADADTQPLDVWRRAAAAGEETAAAVLAEMRAMRLLLVVNQARSRPDMELPTLLRSTARRRTGLPVEALGVLESDEAVWLAVRKRRPLLLEFPEARTSKNVERAVRRLVALDAEPEREPDRPRGLFDLNHYELLDVDPGSTEEEVRRAWRRARDLYAGESLAIRGVHGEQELPAIAARLQEAYETLMDPERRRSYDVATFPEGASPSAQQPDWRASVVAVPPPMPSRLGGPPPEIGPDTEFSGELLRRLRESRGAQLADIARQTKIGASHLRAIEEEAFSALPAAVYVRGFLVEYARFLKLPANEVTRSYLARMKRGTRAEE